MRLASIHRLAVAIALGSGALVAACLAHAQGVAPAAPPPTAWRPITLQVAGAEQPVRLETLKVDVEIAGGIAETRVEMTFLNPNARILEGQLKFPLAPRQVVSGFSLDVDGVQRDAVPVEKARGQQVFEDIARRGVDPGLLQSTLGNNYELRIYPLPPGKTRTVVLKLIEPASGRLQVPLGYATRVANLAVSLREAGAVRAPMLTSGATLGLAFGPDPRGGFVARTARTDVALPAAPLVVESAARPGIDVTTEERDGQSWFAATLPVSMQRAPRQIPRRVEIVWDTSGSGAQRQLDRELALLDAYFGRVRDTTVMLVRVADVASAPERFDVRGGDWQRLRRALQTSVYDGASNLGAVRHDGVSDEVLWFTDGLANYGEAWKIAFPVPVFAINSAASSDAAALQVLADRSGGRSIDLGALSPVQAKEALLERGTHLVDLTATGASELVVESRQAAAGRLVIAGQLTARNAEIRVQLRDADGRTSTQVLHVDARQGASRLAALQWARLTLATLAGEASIHRARIRAIGQRFGLATPETSLIVLERVEDYVQNGIEPPAALRDAYARLLATSTRSRASTDSARLEQLVRRFDARIAWWQRDFPKDKPPAPEPIAAKDAGMRLRERAVGETTDRLRMAQSPVMAAPPAAVVTPAPAANRLATGDLTASMGATNAKAKSVGRDSTTIAISLTPAANGSAAVKRLAAAPRADQWRIYLDERSANTNNVGFFLEAADFFIEHGERAIGLRVLSNLAELDLQNRQVLRLLAYRLQQAGEFELAVPVFERVLVLAPNEPQSHRDLGLALAETGRAQAAIDRLHDVAIGAWDARFADIDLIALAELNAIVEKSTGRGEKIDVSRIDRRLLKNLPLALRVVLAWDADNTDVDLHVIDPNGEEVFYSHPKSYQGGAITRDATGGYGPEEFALRIAKPGIYRVEANFYGQRQQVLTTDTGLMLTLSSGFATPQQQDRRSTRRVKSTHGERVVIGEFEVKG